MTVLSAFQRLARQQMKGFSYVYILSQKDQTVHYIGLTRDLQERLLIHNQGACGHTSKYRPWRIETAIAFKSERKARAFEKYLKRGSGRDSLAAIFDLLPRRSFISIS